MFAALLARCGHLDLCPAQVPQFPFTFTAMPVTNQSTGTPKYQNNIFLLSTSAISPTYLTVAHSTGLPTGADSIQFVIDIESMKVASTFNGGANVLRGANGTRSFAHGALSRVWIAPARYFLPRNPIGICQPATQLVTPSIAIPSGQAFVCEGNGQWGGADFSWATASLSGQPTTYPYTSQLQPAITWGNATNQGIWQQQQYDQGDWAQGAIAWGSSTFKWEDIAGLEPQILNTLP